VVVRRSHYASRQAIKSGKEKRNPYRPVSGSCCNHGGCSYCLSNRTIQTKRAKGKANIGEQVDEFIDLQIGAGDPIDALMSHDEEVLERHGIDPWDFETRRELDV
jgi:hypothetical protein